MASSVPVIFFHEFSNLGAPLSGGKLYAFAAGTDTPKVTYTDPTGSVAAAHPIVLNSAGRASVWVAPGGYKFVLYDSNDSLIWSQDNCNEAETDGVFTAIDSISDLRDLSSGFSDYVYVGYSKTAPDNGGGMFYWDADNEDADNDGTIITPSSAPAAGRWIRQYTGPLLPNFFGAVGTGGIDGTDEIQACIDVAADNDGEIHFPQGSYYLSDDLTFPSNVSVSFDEFSEFTATGTVAVAFQGPVKGGARPKFEGAFLTVSFAQTFHDEMFVEWFTSLANAITVIGSQTVTLVLSDLYVLSDDLIIPKNIQLVFKNQAQINLNSHALTINGPIQAPNKKIFLNGSPTFGYGALEIQGSWFGLVGDDSTDNLAAFQKLITSVSNSGGGTVILGSGTFRTTQVVYLTSNLVLIGQGPLKTIIKASNSFSQTNYYGVVGVNENMSNIIIKDLGIDGNKAQNPGRPIENCLALMSCTDIYMENLLLTNCPQNDNGNGGDGITIGKSPTSVSVMPSNIMMQNCTMDLNVRQGCSIICGKNLAFEHCVFKGTTGSNPGAGVDIEPNNDINEIVEGVRFTDCLFYGNGGDGFQIYNAFDLDVANIVVENCTIEYNTRFGVRVIYGRDPLIISNSRIRFNGDDGINMIPAHQAVIKNCQVYRNTGYGIYMAGSSYGNLVDGNHIYQNTKSGIWLTYIYGGNVGHTISRNTIYNNSYGAIGSYNGIDMVGNASHLNMRVDIFGNKIGNDASRYGTASQGYGIVDDVSCHNNSISYNSFDANISGPYNGLSTYNFVEFNWLNGSAYISVANAINSIGLNLNGGITVASTATAASYTTASVVLKGGLGIGDNLIVKNTAQIHDVRPVYLMGDDPAIGLNLYYSSGWKFGVSASAKYGAAIVLDTASGGIDLRATSGTGTTGATGSTLTSILTMYAETNIRVEAQGRLNGKLGANVASANNLTLGDGNVFHITGTTNIKLISSVNWVAGSTIVLIFDSALILEHNVAPSGNFKPFFLSIGGSAGNQSVPANEVYTFTYDGTYWRWHF